MLSRTLRRLHYLLNRRRYEAELTEEMAFHRSMTDGRTFGNATLALEDSREVWLTTWLESVWRDLAYGLRTLAREPGFALLAIGALTAGVGLNSSLFTVYTALAMKPWPVREPERVVRVISHSRIDLRRRAGGAPGGFSQAQAEYFAQHARTFNGFTLLGRAVDVRIGDADARASWVGGNFFSVLGAEMAVGRPFDSEEERVDAPVAVAVLSHGLWQRQFGRDVTIVGRQVRIDDVPFTVVGVAAARFLGTDADRVDVWLPRASAPLLRPDDRWVRNVAQKPENCCTPLAARLAPGAAREQAAAELSLLNRQFRSDRPEDDGDVTLTGTELLDAPKGGGGAGVFVPLAAGMLLVLLLACANVGNLLLARAAARQREIAVRLSIGAGRWRLVRQLLTESFAMAAIAGVGGLLLAAWLPRQIVKLVAGVPVALQLEPDARVLAFTVAAVFLSCVLFGLVPAVQATRSTALRALKEGSALPGARFSLRALLLSVQVAAVVVLLAAAGVMTRSARQVTDRVLPERVRGVLSISIRPPVRGYDAARTRILSMQVIDAVEQAGGAQVALTSTPPLASGNIKGGFRLPNRDDDLFNSVFEVSPGYFRLMGLKVRQGRDFAPADRGRPVIVINESMAKEYWPGGNAVGQRIICTPPESGWNMPGELEIIGVVEDAYMTGLEEVGPTVFQPITHRAVPQILAATPAAASSAVAAVTQIDPRLRIRTQPLEDELIPRVRTTRVGALIAGSLGVLALALACVGLFGVFAYWVRQRTQEIGVRMALGAQSSDVVRLVLGTTLRAVMIGIAVGLAASAATARLLTSYLFGLSGIDPVTYVAVSLLLVAASLLAAFVPARRATRIDPLVALRYE